MPEPTNDPFTAFDPEVAVPSPADIRRRGDRLRRRNTALAVVGGVAAVAIIATPLALLTGGGSSSAPPATNTPSVTDPATPAPSEPTGQTLVIPDDFPLTDGLQEFDDYDYTVTDQSAFEQLEPCGEVLWAPDGPAAASLDVAGVTAFDSSMAGRTRTLAVYASEDDSAAALQRLRTGLLDCPSVTADGAELTFEQVSSSENESVFTRRTRTGGSFGFGIGVYQFHREGNALLLTSYDDLGESTTEAVTSNVDLAHTEITGVYAAMADVFGDGGTTESGSADDLSTFALADGLPEGSDAQPGDTYGRFGPSTSLAPFDYATCNGEQLPIPADAQTLRASYLDVEYGRRRALLTFPSADGAVAFMGDARAFYEDCPDRASDDGFVGRHDIVDVPVGAGGFGVGNTSTDADGNPTGTDLEVIQFVRVGRAVLIDETYGEGGGVPDLVDAMIGELDDQAAAASGVVDAMCRFTAEGC